MVPVKSAMAVADWALSRVMRRVGGGGVVVAVCTRGVVAEGGDLSRRRDHKIFQKQILVRTS